MAGRNNTFIITNKPIDEMSKRFSTKSYTCCGHHNGSYSYRSHVNTHHQIIDEISRQRVTVDMTTPIHIRIAFHVLAPTDTFSPSRVLQRANEIIQSINDDFNNYSSNPYIMNFLKYKNVVTEVFFRDIEKQRIYLSEEYQNTIPTKPSHITFELGEIYYYPVVAPLNLTPFDDIVQVELESQAIKHFIFQHNAVAINPDKFLNIWIVDMFGSDILGFTNFPWEPVDIVNGIIINRKVFFPEELTDNDIFFPYDRFKFFTHEIGHYLGLLHPFDNENNTPQAAVNMNEDGHREPKFPHSTPFTNDYIADTPFEFEPVFDPYLDQILLRDLDYNPLFMNFMDFTFDEFVTNFTFNQIQKMRYMIFTYRPYINSLDNIDCILPIPKFNPITRTLVDTIESAAQVDISTQIAQLAANEQQSRERALTKGTAKYNKFGQLIENNQKLAPNKETKKSAKRFIRKKPL